MNKLLGLNLLDNLATGINKEDPTIKAILSNGNGEGAVANELEELNKFIYYYTHTSDVREHKEKSLEMIALLFAKLRKRVEETDEIYLRQLLALTYRQGDIIWGNAVNLKNVFENYFSGVKCFVAENTNNNNFMPGSTFSGGTWELDGTAQLAFEARFVGNRGLFFDGQDGSCEQIVERYFAKGNYTFHFMLKGKCGLIIQREDGKYWNANEQGFTGDAVLEWADNEVINYFEKDNGWDNASCFIVLPEAVNELTFKFVNVDDNIAYIDYVRLYEKLINPAYTLILQFDGFSITPQALHIGIDGNDPIPGLEYSRESYFDKSFVIGASTTALTNLYNNLLEKIKPAGIQVFTEYINRDMEE